MRKKLGPLWLKLFDWVYVPGAGISYAPCPNQFLPYLRTGFGWWWSPPSRIRDGGPVPINRYVLVRDCWSPPKNPLHLWFRRVFGEPFPRDPYRYIHQLDWVPKTLLFLFSMKKSGCIVLSDLVLSLPSLIICLSVVCRVCRILLWCNPFEHSSDPFVCTTNTGILLQILR